MRSSIVGVVAALVVAVTGCAVPDEVAGDVPGRLPASAPAMVPPRDDVVDPGLVLWQSDYALGGGDTGRVEVEGPWFAASVRPANGPITAALGVAATGEVLAEWELPDVPGWPLLVPDQDEPGLLMVTEQAGEQVLEFRDTAGGGFALPASEFGAGPGERLKAEEADGQFAVVRVLGADRSKYGSAALHMVDTRAGALAWSADISPRRIDLTFGLLTADYRESGEPAAPSDRVRTWQAATGEVLVDEAMSQEDEFPPLLCGGAVAADRLLYCGSDLAESGEMLLVTTDGEALLRREVMGRPALDRDSGVIAAHLPGGGVAAFSATTGEEVWSWSAQEAESRLLTAGRGGFLLGGLGQDNIVVESATGQVLLVEPFYHVPDAQWNGSVAIRFENAGLTGRQGSGPLLGQQITGAQDLMFLRTSG